MEKESRYTSQIPFFGEEGQKKIAQTTVAIVGLGGLGSHVAQQLAYLGVGNLILIDDDHVEEKNLNRLIGAGPDDIDALKVDIAKRMITFIQPKANVYLVPKKLQSEAIQKISEADFIFGCVDKDGVRLILLEAACHHKKPYIDLATEIMEDEFGGRIVFTGLGAGCPHCREELDQEEIKDFFSTPEQLAEKEKIYGVSRGLLGESGPSVVMLNGIIASLAVMEFVAFVTGIRKPLPYLMYRGSKGMTFTRSRPSRTGDCFYCEGITRMPNLVDINRHIKE